MLRLAQNGRQRNKNVCRPGKKVSRARNERKLGIPRSVPANSVRRSSVKMFLILSFVAGISLMGLAVFWLLNGQLVAAIIVGIAIIYLLVFDALIFCALSGDKSYTPTEEETENLIRMMTYYRF